jgi:quaternary ammonium compound-resistance protein SugE
VFLIDSLYATQEKVFIMTASWFFLFLAGFFEICFTIALKFSLGFTRLVPSIITVIFIVLSFFCVSQAMKTIPIGTAYAIWAGIGAAGTVICGIFLFGDSYHIIRLLSISLIVIGIIGLKLVNVEG